MIKHLRDNRQMAIFVMH